eukprot:scaffold256_cov261-Pinguiococcus_pyrenoidosus.AAC.23
MCNALKVQCDVRHDDVARHPRATQRNLHVNESLPAHVAYCEMSLEPLSLPHGYANRQHRGKHIENVPAVALIAL